MTYPAIFHTGTITNPDPLAICQDALQGWALYFSGFEPPAMFEAGMCEVRKALGVVDGVGLYSLLKKLEQ